MMPVRMLASYFFNHLNNNGTGTVRLNATSVHSIYTEPLCFLIILKYFFSCTSLNRLMRAQCVPCTLQTGSSDTLYTNFGLQGVRR